jgi:hypothetical protein
MPAGREKKELTAGSFFFARSDEKEAVCSRRDRNA